MLITSQLPKAFVPRAAAASPTPAAPAATSDKVQISGLGKVLRTTGNAMAKLGGFGGLAVGAAVGLGAGLALGSFGYLLPLVGAVTLGAECADAHRAKMALDAGKHSPEFLRRQRTNSSLTPIGPATHVLSGVAGLGAMTAGIVFGGMPYGLLGGAAAALGAAVLVIAKGHKAERAILQGS